MATNWTENGGLLNRTQRGCSGIFSEGGGALLLLVVLKVLLMAGLHNDIYQTHSRLLPKGKTGWIASISVFASCSLLERLFCFGRKSEIMVAA